MRTLERRSSVLPSTKTLHPITLGESLWRQARLEECSIFVFNNLRFGWSVLAARSRQIFLQFVVDHALIILYTIALLVEFAEQIFALRYKSLLMIIGYEVGTV